MWRWQSLRDYSYPLISLLRIVYPRKMIVQGYEWNVPTHEHASVGIVGASEAAGSAVARHEYLFDASATGTTSDSILGVTGKVANSHVKAVAGAAWLQANYLRSSYFLLNHPSRKLLYSVADIDFTQNPRPPLPLPARPQKEPYRGGYGNNLGVNTSLALRAAFRQSALLLLAILLRASICNQPMRTLRERVSLCMRRVFTHCRQGGPMLRGFHSAVFLSPGASSGCSSSAIKPAPAEPLITTALLGRRLCRPKMHWSWRGPRSRKNWARGRTFP